jgi:cytochrome c biogenesis protein CcmG/thiol:disulfide interchange protein DsbE
MSGASKNETPPEVRRRGSAQARWIVAAVAVCALLALFWPHGQKTTETPGGFLVDAAGRPQPLGQRLTPVTLLHFWATWCAPCVEEIPRLWAFTKTLGDDPEFRLVLIAVEDNLEQAEAFVGDVAPQLLFDPRWDVAHRYGTYKIPETYLLVNGALAKKFAGSTDWSLPDIRAEVTHHFESAPAPTSVAGRAGAP